LLPFFDVLSFYLRITPFPKKINKCKPSQNDPVNYFNNRGVVQDDGIYGFDSNEN
jgi:hypothetical protein